jgi:perosamine synthetase
MIPVCEPYLNGNELKYVDDAVRTGWISSSGKYVKAFEEAFAEYCDVKYAVATCNGTTALHLSLVCLDIGKGDEVIVPDFTMIASAFSVCYTGAKPVFVDADEKTWNIDVSKIEEKITHQTKAIMPVHIFGNPCDMDAIHKIAKKYNLFIIEDAAEAHGSLYKGKKVGSFSDIAVFSFFANKNITTGEGGMVVTDNERLYKKALYHKNLCFNPDAPRNYAHHDIGYNYRMSNLHAAIGLAQTEKADEYKEMRICNGKLYRKYCKDIKGIILQECQADAENVFWMNGILLNPEKYGKTRDELINLLTESGIDTRLFFVGMHRQLSLLKFGCDGTGHYPITDKLSRNGFYLPSASNLKQSEIKHICDVINLYSKQI